MAITNLTGYTWVGNETLTLSTFSYNLSFVDEDSVSYGGLGARFNQDIMGMALYYDDFFLVYNVYQGWIDSAYKTILITGGTDVTDPTLISWLEDNGTLTPPSSPPSISDKLQELIDIKQDIKVAIENKDVDLTDVAFSGYAEKIDDIPLQKEEQTKTVTEPNFSSGNVVVTPDAGKVLTQVTVVKDNDLVPENIVKDVNIFGVVGTSAIAVELTQAQYDALPVYDYNTYYLIVEE